jgi:hypothetical protein
MERGKYRFERLLKLLPEGWEANVSELNAFQRARGIPSPKDLLKTMNTAHLQDRVRRLS